MSKRSGPVLEITEYLAAETKGAFGGQRQRVAMGRADRPGAITSPHDGALSNLDAKLRVPDALADCMRRAAAYTVYVTHNRPEHDDGIVGYQGHDAAG